MSKKMLINASHPEENRVAIVVDGILSELDIEIAGQEQTKGNIYKAVVVRVEPGLQAAFVDYGAEKMGFLQIGEIHPNLYPNAENLDTRNRPRINDILKRGQELLVQIVKEERGTKGAALTTFLSLPGRYMVLMPDSKTKGVSRKITDEKERKELKKSMATLDLPDRMGYIVRTAGIGKEPEELKRDFDYLVNLHQGILHLKEQVKAPAQLYQESNLAIRSIRDYFSNDMDEVLIDDPGVFRDAKDFFSLVMPDLAGLVKLHREKRPIFSRFQIEDQIEGLARNQIPLPSGGSIVIDQTEALVAIDVNSGKLSSESGIEATAGRTNLEAAAEIGRQLRLRDLGGLIVIDFIDMRDRKRIREVEDVLRKSLRDDKAKVTVGRISQFGLLEMSRQRIKAALSVGAYLTCPHCQGKGRIKSIEAQAVALLRQLHASASKGQISRVDARVPLDVANYLLNEKRATISDLERQLNLVLSIEGRPSMTPGQVEIELQKREKPAASEQDSAPISHANRIEGALASAARNEQVETIQEAEQTTDATDNDKSESSGRKRKRRRRKRSSSQEPAETIEAVTTGSPDASAVEEAGEQTPPEAPETETEQPSGPSDKPAAKRSRRSPRKPAAKSDAAKDAAADSEQSKTEKPAADASEKPKRRSRRKTAAVESKTEQQPPAGQNAEQAAAEPAAEEEKKPVPSSKRSRRQTSRKNQVQAGTTSGQDTAADAKVTTEDTIQSTPEPEKPASKPRRSRRKPASSKETQPTSEPTAASAESPEKPKRRNRKKTTATENKPKTEAAPAVTPSEQTSVDTGPADSPAPVGTGANPQTPKRRSPRKSAPSPKTENTQEETLPGKDSTATRPQRRTRKKTADPATETADTAVAPKRRSTRSRSTTKNPKSEQPEPPAENAETKPKRRTSRKKTTAQTEARSETD